MKKSTKAVLFSLLIFPGAGHFLIRKWIWGLLFMAVTLLSSGVLINYGFNKANDIMDRALSGEVPLDPEAIEALLREPPPPDEALMLKMSQWLLLTCWIGSAAHAYVKTESLQKQNEPPSRT